MSIGVMLFNPFTGKPRRPEDIESDPRGVLIWDGEEPLKAAAPAPPQAYVYRGPEPDCRTCARGRDCHKRTDHHGLHV